jgi:hypothetical protein
VRNICALEGCEDNQKGLGYCNRHYKKFKRYGDANYSAFHLTPSERFWARVDKSRDCWLWTGCLNNKGYGIFNMGSGKRVLTHRFSYEDASGPIPEGMVIDHVCHVMSCCNPQHLRVSTQKQNIENQAHVRSDSKIGLRGVEWSSRLEKYVVRIRHNGTRHYAGAFTSPKEAAEAARQLRLSLFTHNDIDRRTA